jgi:hypothetical protein
MKEKVTEKTLNTVSGGAAAKVTNHQLSWWFDYAPPGQVPGPPKGGSLFHSLLAAS